MKRNRNPMQVKIGRKPYDEAGWKSQGNKITGIQQG